MIDRNAPAVALDNRNEGAHNARRSRPNFSTVCPTSRACGSWSCSSTRAKKNVSELVAALGQPQSRVSNHLAVARCGYVDSRREGKFVYYRLADCVSANSWNSHAR